VGRVVVFNQHTKEKLPHDLGASAELSSDFHPQGSMSCLASILDTDREALLVIPSTIEDYVCTIHVRLIPKLKVAPSVEPGYEATGFLGLSDTISEPERPRRWWHWFWS
jgi:hypothetical protein